MAPLNLNINDRSHTVLWYILDRARRTHRAFIEPVTDIRALLRHKIQVTDLITELKNTLRNFYKWSCGRDLVQTLIGQTLRLQTYFWKVFEKSKNQNIIILENFNNNRAEFREIINDLSNLYAD